MRLIDADAMLARLEEWNTSNSTDKALYIFTLNRILEQPTMPSAQPKYEPVKAEDFAKTMSENTIHGFMAWHGEALELMERQGFVICKKTL